jgi:predicted esterase
MAISHLEIRPGLQVSWTGAPLEHGALPGFFYFALSAEESLGQDPYNQPIAALAEAPIRCYSLTLPSHGAGFDHREAMYEWARDVEVGATALLQFLDEVEEAIRFLVGAGWLLKDRIAFGGLSRGGFIATHLAVRLGNAAGVVGYAPLTRISYLSELKGVGQSLDLHALVPRLTRTPIRFYIGNRDLRVSTDACYAFIREVAEAGYADGVRSPMAELFITRSIGHQGHGTPQASFHGGAEWILEQLTR